MFYLLTYGGHPKRGAGQFLNSASFLGSWRSELHRHFLGVREELFYLATP